MAPSWPGIPPRIIRRGHPHISRMLNLGLASTSPTLPVLVTPADLATRAMAVPEFATTAVAVPELAMPTAEQSSSAASVSDRERISGDRGDGLLGLPRGPAVPASSGPTIPETDLQGPTGNGGAGRETNLSYRGLADGSEIVGSDLLRRRGALQLMDSPVGSRYPAEDRPGSPTGEHSGLLQKPVRSLVMSGPPTADVAEGPGGQPEPRLGRGESTDVGNSGRRSGDVGPTTVLLFCRLRRRGYLPFVFCGRLIQPVVDWEAPGGGCFVWTLQDYDMLKESQHFTALVAARGDPSSPTDPPSGSPLLA
eukprot:jgi/Botrbrau1/4686/Bobra.0218s0008.1